MERTYRMLLHPLHHDHVAIKELGHSLTRSSLTRPEVSSEVFLGSFSLMGCSLLSVWVICYVAFDLHVVSNFSCSSVFFFKLGLYLILLKIRPAFSCETCQWQMSPEWVASPEQGKSSGRVATFSLSTACFGMAFLHSWWNSHTAVTRSPLPRSWE
jgi:hypothetical protein